MFVGSRLRVRPAETASWACTLARLRGQTLNLFAVGSNPATPASLPRRETRQRMAFFRSACNESSSGPLRSLEPLACGASVPFQRSIRSPTWARSWETARRRSVLCLHRQASWAGFARPARRFGLSQSSSSVRMRRPASRWCDSRTTGSTGRTSTPSPSAEAGNRHPGRTCERPALVLAARREVLGA